MINSNLLLTTYFNQDPADSGTLRKKLCKTPVITDISRIDELFEIYKESNYKEKYINAVLLLSNIKNIEVYEDWETHLNYCCHSDDYPCLLIESVAHNCNLTTFDKWQFLVNLRSQILNLNSTYPEDTQRIKYVYLDSLESMHIWVPIFFILRELRRWLVDPDEGLRNYVNHIINYLNEQKDYVQYQSCYPA